MKFEMSITDNYAAFIDEKTGAAVFVDSFDNEEFEVRISSVQSSDLVGKIKASSSDQLNSSLHKLFMEFQGGNE